MGLALLHPVSLALLLGIAAITARVEPPTNVTLQCRSLNNILKWDYNQLRPGLKFRVDIGAYYSLDEEGFRNVVWVESPDLQADVSFLSDPNEAYSLRVTAVVGDNQSDASPPEDDITFSYDNDLFVNHKCFLDFPSVNLTVQPHNSVLLRFEHPWLSFHEKLVGNKKPKARRKKSHDVWSNEELPVFDYSVQIVNQTLGHHTYSCEESVCEEELPVDPLLDKHCLHINGDLEKMIVKGTEVYCALLSEQTSPSHTYFIYIGLALSAAVFGAILYMVWLKKTKPSTQTLSSRVMTFDRSPMPRLLEPAQESYSVLESPTPLPSRTDEEHFSPLVARYDDQDFRMAIPLPAEGEGVSDEVQVNQPGEEEPAYMQGNSLEGDEMSEEVSDEAPARSGYEQREVLVQMGPDEPVRGYHARTSENDSAYNYGAEVN